MIKKVFLGALVALCACTKEEPLYDDVVFAKPEVEIEDGVVLLSAQQKGYCASYEDFAFAACDRLMAPGANFAFSPTSMVMSLSLAANGADGVTYEQIVDALGLHGSNFDEINALNYTMLQALPKLDSSVDISFANGMFAASEYKLLAPFRSRLEEAYDAAFFTLSKQNGVAQINSWVEAKTRGRITKLVQEQDFSDEFPNFAFVNACYMQAPWKCEFAKADDMLFRGSDGRGAMVESVAGLQIVGYGTVAGAQVVSLPIGLDAGFEMMIVLPSEGTTVADALSAIRNNGGFSAIEMKRQTAMCRLPKFAISLEADLEKCLKEMGVTDMWEDTANFYKMALVPSKVSAVKQACEFGIDENGICGAAASMVGGFATSTEEEAEPMAFEVDRPFGFCVREASTSAILFVGAVNSL